MLSRIHRGAVFKAELRVPSGVLLRKRDHTKILHLGWGGGTFAFSTTALLRAGWFAVLLGFREFTTQVARGIRHRLLRT